MNRAWKENPLVLTLIGWLVGLPLIYLWVKYFFFYGVLVIAGLYIVLMIFLFARIVYDEASFYENIKGWRKVALIFVSVLVGTLVYLAFGIAYRR